MDRRIDLETTVNADLETTVNATLDEVWHLWTTTEGIKSFLVDEANIELEPGGTYEVLFDMSAKEGFRGSEGCCILSYLPQEMLSFTWNAPPTIPKLRKLGPCTWVVVRFESMDDKIVRVKLSFHSRGMRRRLFRNFAS